MNAGRSSGKFDADACFPKEKWSSFQRYYDIKDRNRIQIRFLTQRQDDESGTENGLKDKGVGERERMLTMDSHSLFTIDSVRLFI